MSEFIFDKYVEGAQQVWDASSLKTFMACPQKYQLENLLGYRSNVRSPATYWGTAVHHGCEILDGAAHAGIDKEIALRDACRAVCLEYGETLNASTDNARNLQTALRALIWRCEEYNYDTIEVASLPDGTPALEARFECPFPGTDWRFSGRIDKLAIYNKDLYVVDTKTTKSALNDRYWSYYEPDVQIAAYTWATRHIIGMPVKGVLIEGISTGVNYTRFVRRLFNVDEPRIEEWLSDAKMFLDWADQCAKADHWPHNYNSCGSYGGCQFQQICALAPSRRSYWLDRDFSIKQHATLETADAADPPPNPTDPGDK